MGLRTLPIPVKRAERFVRQVHRKLPEVAGSLWSVCALRGDDMIGVALVGRPVARLSDASGKVAPQPNLEVTRVAVREGDRSDSGNKGACSILYGACAKAARGMGAENLFTFTHASESQVSLNAAGWVNLGFRGGGDWDRDLRPRQEAFDAEKKVIWFAPWSKVVRERDAAT